MNPGETGTGVCTWGRHQWWALANREMKVWAQYFEKSFSNCTTGGFSRSAQLHEVLVTIIRGVGIERWL
jgi:hypothetical protein